MIDGHVTLATACAVIASQRGDPFQQGRFAGAVLADDGGDGKLKVEFEVVGQER